MNTYAQSNHPPTDIMCSRTPLLFLGHFLWLGKQIAIRTDSPEILRAAQSAGLRKAHHDGRGCDLRWDVVAEPQAGEVFESWQCETIQDGKSLHLNMGSHQWFAFDMETGSGAGFVIVAGSDRSSGLNVETYFQAILKNVVSALFPPLRRESNAYGD
jgi:hypothetical protein